MIRLIKPDDFNKCCDIYNYYVINTSISFDLKPLSYLEYENKINKIIEKYPFLVYEENNEILGFAYLDEFNSRGAYFTTADLTIYLKPNITHKGIGSSLYLELEKYAKKMKIHLLISLITETNEISKSFHEKMGFKYLATIKNAAIKNNKWESLVYYQKEIRPIGEILWSITHY